VDGVPGRRSGPELRGEGGEEASLSFPSGISGKVHVRLGLDQMDRVCISGTAIRESATVYMTQEHRGGILRSGSLVAFAL